MDISGDLRIGAPRDVVWACLNDPDILKQCIPGCQSLEWISPTKLSAAIVIKIAFLSATFTGEITLSNLNPPDSYTISGEGKGGVAGFAQGGADVVLVDDGAETILRYEAGAQMGGRIAQMGSKLVGSFAGKLAERFFANFNAAVIARTAEIG